MRSLTPLVDHRLNASLAWAATATLLLSAGGFLLGGAPHWVALAGLLAAAALVPAGIDRDPSVTFPGELLVMVALPVVARAGGLFPQATPFLAVAGLGLLVAILLDEYTTLTMTPRFAVVFVVLTTLSFAGVWTVGVWLSDRFLGTAFVGGQAELMWDIVVAATMGVVGGLVVLVYFDRTDHDDGVSPEPAEDRGDGAAADSGTLDDGDRPEPASADRPEPTAADGPGPTSADRPELTDSDGVSRAARLAVRTLQVGLAGFVLLGAGTGNWGLLVNSAVPLAVTFLPALLRREYGYSMHAGLVLWLTLAVFLHAVGALGPYQDVGWYDSLTHALSGTLVAGVGYAVARAVELHTQDVSFSPRFRAVFLVLFVLATGVCWELLEFSTGLAAEVTGGEAALAQYGVDDIALDLVYNVLGALVVAAWGTGYFERPARALVGSVGGLVGRE
jgi:flagellar biosynthesis protein FliQ